jgi:hypothetical protein
MSRHPAEDGPDAPGPGKDRPTIPNVFGVLVVLVG